MYFTGQDGCIQIRRATEDYMETVITPNDLNLALNRFGFERSEYNIITGDFVELWTADPRGIAWLPVDAFYAHVSADGAIRAFPTYEAAINNDRTQEYPLTDFSQAAPGAIDYGNAAAVCLQGTPEGDYGFSDIDNGVRSICTDGPAFSSSGFNAGTADYDNADVYPRSEIRVSTFAISCTVRVRDKTFEPLGGVTNYTFDSDRAALDVTTLGDAFTHQLGQGLISGSGTIDCLFDYRRQINCPSMGVGELPVLLLQLILRFDLGSAFSAYLQLAPETDQSQPVFYEIQGIVTRAGTTVGREGLITCSINYVTTGEYRLVIGEPSGYILKEDDDRIQKEQDLDFLLKEPED